MKRADPREIAKGQFDAAEHMREPFLAFMNAAQECADLGWIVSIRPDDEGEWKQQLYIYPEASVLAVRAILENEHD